MEFQIVSVVLMNVNVWQLNLIGDMLLCNYRCKMLLLFILCLE